MAQKLHELYRKLDEQLDEANWAAAVESCDKILAQKADEKEAFQSKIFALLQSDKFDEVLKQVNNNKDFGKGMVFERAYSYYRLKQFQKALDEINTQTTLSQQLLHLRSQIYFRMEDARCIDGYTTLIKDHKVESPELITNYTAALSRGKQADKVQTVLDKHRKVVKESYEALYNAACCYIDQGKLDDAQTFLEAAEKTCREAMKRDGASEEEIKDELAVIRAQQAFVRHTRGKAKEAMEIYEEVLKSPVSDVSVSAVCNNNIVALNKDQDKFNSFNRLKHLGAEAVQDKLSTAQKRAIVLNRCVLLLLMNKADECREQLKLFEAEFPNSEYAPIILSSLQFRDRKVQKAEQILKDWIQAHPKNCTRVQLSLAQLYLSQDNLPAVVETLKSIESLRHAPAMITTLARLCEQTGDLEAAIKILDEGFERVTKADDDATAQMMKKSADFKIKNKLYREASVTLEKILKGSPNDIEALPKIVIALAAVDPAQAERYASRLPDAAAAAGPLDIDKLENVQGPQFARKERAAEPTAVAATNEQAKKQKKKRKRQNPPAKKADFSKPPDPERWLPRKERSTYKPRRVKGGAKGSTRSSGAQGNVADSAAQTSLSKTALAKPKDEEPPKPTPASPKQAPAAAAKQPPPAAAKKGKGKKR